METEQPSRIIIQKHFIKIFLSLILQNKPVLLFYTVLIFYLHMNQHFRIPTNSERWKTICTSWQCCKLNSVQCNFKNHIPELFEKTKPKIYHQEHLPMANLSHSSSCFEFRTLWKIHSLDDNKTRYNYYSTYSVPVFSCILMLIKLCSVQSYLSRLSFWWLGFILLLGLLIIGNKYQHLVISLHKILRLQTWVIFP